MANDLYAARSLRADRGEAAIDLDGVAAEQLRIREMCAGQRQAAVRMREESKVLVEECRRGLGLGGERDASQSESGEGAGT